jgi:hypothetical protein
MITSPKNAKNVATCLVFIVAWSVLSAAAGCSEGEKLPTTEHGDSGLPDANGDDASADAAHNDANPSNTSDANVADSHTADGNVTDGNRYDAAQDGGPGGDTGVDSGTAPPTGLSYETSSMVCTVGTEVAANHAQVTGLQVSFTIRPELPAGLHFDTTNGTISGTPTAVSAATQYTITATNSGGSTEVTVSIAVNLAKPGALSYDVPNAIYTKNTAIANNVAHVTGEGLSFSIQDNKALPLGLSLNTSNGTISGTPTEAMAQTTYTIIASNSGGNVSASISITVKHVTPSDLGYEVTQAIYTGNEPIAVNHVAHVTGEALSYAASSLPTGLTIDSSTGAISGTPTVESPLTDYTVTVSNSGGSTTATIRIAVSPAPDAHWTFDEGTGDTANDASGHGHAGALSGTPKPSWIAGEIGSYALEFGESEIGVAGPYVEVPAHAEFDVQTFTFAAWLYSDNGNSTCAYARRINGWHLRTSSAEWDIKFEGGGDTIGSNADFPDKEWHHYVVVVDNLVTVKTVTFYIDGEITGESHTYTNGFVAGSTGTVYIGRFDAAFRWKGRIDDVRFYGKALNSSSIQLLYQQNRP